MSKHRRWVKHPINQMKESPEKIERFLKELEQLCVNHGVVISHEDSHGAFIVEPMNASGLEQLVVDIHISGRFFT